MPDSTHARSILLISSPNKPGILKEVADFVNKRKGNIVSLQQLVEKNDKQLFMRVKWTCQSKDACDIGIKNQFKPIAEKYKMDYKVSCSTQIKKLGLFTSKTTHCLEKVLYSHSENDIQVEIPLIISNSKSAEKVAKRYDIPFYFISTEDKNYEKKQLQLLKEHKVDFIGLARYMKILSPEFVNEYNNKIINIHHSFLPSFVGAKAYEEAYNRGVKLIGATSHFVIPKLDQGPIIQQDVSRVKEGYDEYNIKNQGKDVESKVFYYAIRKYAQDKLLIYKNRVIVFGH